MKRWAYGFAIWSIFIWIILVLMPVTNEMQFQWQAVLIGGALAATADYLWEKLVRG